VVLREEGSRALLLFLAAYLIHWEVDRAMAKARASCAVEASLLEFLRSRGLRPEDRLAVGFSGGPDSTALLGALHALGWRNLLAVYVDHGIRPRTELDAEIALVKETCARLRTGLVVARIRTGAVLERARASGRGVEAEARDFRRTALAAAAERRGARAILLAHTRDDQAETVLMRLFGGSGAGGIRGIPESSGLFLRPLLGTSKAQLLSYIGGKGLPYSVDSTNASGRYLRNRVRRDLVPALDACFPGWRKGLARAQAKARRDEEALGAAAEPLGFHRLPDGRSSCPAEPLLAAPEAVAIRAIVAAAARQLGEERLSSGMAAAALRALKAEGSASYTGKRLRILRSGGEVILESVSSLIGRGGLDFPRRDGYFVSVDRPCQFRIGKLEVRVAWRDPARQSGGGTGIREGAFSFPIVVRSRRPGDAIALKAGRKRLDKLFSEWGMPERSRAMVPIIEDRDGIVAVLAAGIGGKDRYRTGHGKDGPQGDIPRGSARRLSIIVKGA
jgi:tRNA(Ile)-lysidine synthase